jgi:hypothetical protein
MADHWFVRHFPSFITVARVVVLLAGAIPGVVAAIKGYPMELVAFLGIGGVSLAFAGIYFLLQIGDYIEAQGEYAQMGVALADALEDRISVGDKAFLTGRVATIWNEADPPATDLRQNTKFRWIKASVDRGYVQGQPLNPNGKANTNTMVQLKDCAVFFRRKDWRKLVG